MKRLIGMAVAIVLAESMVVYSNGSRASSTGADANFTGSVIVEPLYSANDHTSSTGGHVIFAPGARSAWHTHPAGQILIITGGTGWVQEEGAEKREGRCHLDASGREALA